MATGQMLPMATGTVSPQAPGAGWSATQLLLSSPRAATGQADYHNNHQIGSG